MEEIDSVIEKRENINGEIWAKTMGILPKIIKTGHSSVKTGCLSGFLKKQKICDTIKVFRSEKEKRRSESQIREENNNMIQYKKRRKRKQNSE